jgi:hypothetical protein
LAGYKGQSAPERGFRFLKDPRFLASSLYLQKPERLMALLRVMTVCLLVYAALEYRMRQALQVQQETFPDQKGQPGQTPTARWVVHYFVGIHILLGIGEEQLLESLRRNSWLPGLSNDRAIRCLGRLFGFEFLGFGYTALADPPGALDLQRCDTVDYAQSCARFLAVSWPRSALSPGGCR